MASVPPRPLPSPPRISLTIVRDRTATASASGGFLDVRRLDLALHYPDGTESAPFAYDIAVRKTLDVSVIAAHYADANRVRHVFLRSSFRPPLALREAPTHMGSQWELPAGLIDAGETAREAAVRELEEELGFHVTLDAMMPLGPPSYPVSGMCAELHEYFHVEVDPTTRATPSEDGSALERGAAIIAIPLDDALEHCRTGALADTKLELALRRLAEALAS